MNRFFPVFLAGGGQWGWMGVDGVEAGSGGAGGWVVLVFYRWVYWFFFLFFFMVDCCSFGWFGRFTGYLVHLGFEGLVFVVL